MSEFENSSDVPETDATTGQDQVEEGPASAAAPVIPTVRTTGDPDIDEVLVTLDGLEDLPVGEHPPFFAQAHDTLRDALAGRADPAKES